MDRNILVVLPIRKPAVHRHRQGRTADRGAGAHDTGVAGTGDPDLEPHHAGTGGLVGELLEGIRARRGEGWRQGDGRGGHGGNGKDAKSEVSHEV
ncbi:hypothetical protein [Fodinicola feengrottensis]|uniref:hypothetical protein n=1 Tax=Fodinicola feengrottensis TaxID=435914 RepID=UPI002442C79E|nr:hypothetical protein [Fodinicola feengrottensis]